MSIIISDLKMPEPDEYVEVVIFGNGTVLQTGESWRSPEDGKCYYTTTNPEKYYTAYNLDI